MFLNLTGEPIMFYLGIDQHAKQLTINLRDTEGNSVLKRQVSTRPEKVLEFFEQLTARCAQGKLRLLGNRRSLWLQRLAD